MLSPPFGELRDGCPRLLPEQCFCLHALTLSVHIAQAKPAIYSLLGWGGSASWEIMCHARK